jgi:lysophospholipase L1-like esterase
MRMQRNRSRLTRLLIFGVCLAASLGAVSPSSASEKTAVGRDKATHMTTTDRSNTLFCVGDSIVEDLRLHETAGYAVFNAGISGAGVRTFLRSGGNILQQARGTTVLLAIGVNDAHQGATFSAETWEAEYRELCARLAAGAAGFIAQTVLPLEKSQLWGEPSFIEHINTMNGIIRNVAKERGYCLIDMHAHFADRDGWMLAGGTTDGVHLTGASYEKWREYWEEQLPRCRKGK